MTRAGLPYTGDPEVVRSLLQHGANPNVENLNEAPFYVASRKVRLEAIKFLLNYKRARITGTRGAGLRCVLHQQTDKMVSPGYYFVAAGSQFTERGSKHIASYNVRIEYSPHVDAGQVGWDTFARCGAG